MKKLFVLLLAALLTISMCACDQGGSDVKTDSSQVQSSAVESVEEESTDKSEKNSDTSEKTESSEVSAQTTASSAADYETAVFGKDVLTVNITADKDKWTEFLENAGSKPWIQCDIDIDGETCKDVGIKTKGNTSLQQLVNDDTTTRYSLKVNFGKYTDGQTCHGLDKLALNNIYADSTYLKEYMSYDLLKYMNIPSSLCTFAEIKVNGEHFGFYLAVEDVDDSYIDRIYGSDSSVKLYKPESMDIGDAQGNMPDGQQPPQMPDGQNGQQPPQMSGGQNGQQPPQMSGGQNGQQPPQMPDGERPSMPEGMEFHGGNDVPGNMPGGMDGGRGGVDLNYTDDNIESYSNIFDNSINKSEEEDQKRLIDSLKNISEGKDLEKYIDTDELLRYVACNVFLVNLDSYLSSNCHNYILAEDNGKLSMMPWDYNLSFGSYQMENADSAVNYAIDTVFNGVSAEDRPIISKLLEKEEYREKYHAYLKEIAEKYVQSGQFEKTVDKLCKVIDSYVKSDSTSFDGYDAWKEGAESLKLFTKLRAESVIGQLSGEIPSTKEEQKDSKKLIDASALDLKKLGTMNMDQKAKQADKKEN